jgi:hypothetical protein
MEKDLHRNHRTTEREDKGDTQMTEKEMLDIMSQVSLKGNGQTCGREGGCNDCPLDYSKMSGNKVIEDIPLDTVICDRVIKDYHQQTDPDYSIGVCVYRARRYLQYRKSQIIEEILS